MTKKNMTAIKKYKGYFETLAHETAKFQTLKKQMKVVAKPELFNITPVERAIQVVQQIRNDAPVVEPTIERAIIQQNSVHFRTDVPVVERAIVMKLPVENAIIQQNSVHFRIDAPVVERAIVMKLPVERAIIQQNVDYFRKGVRVVEPPVELAIIQQNAVHFRIDAPVVERAIIQQNAFHFRKDVPVVEPTIERAIIQQNALHFRIDAPVVERAIAMKLPVEHAIAMKLPVEHAIIQQKVGFLQTKGIGNININEFWNNRMDTNKADITGIYKRNIKTIINVYQEVYKNGARSTGLGDFIRGSYYLMNFCGKYKLEYKIVFNHKMRVYLKKFEDQPFYERWKGIEFFTQNNYDGQWIDKNRIIHNLPGNMIDSKFINHLTEDVQVINQTVYSYNIVLPNHIIGEHHKEHMRSILEPTEYMASLVETTMNDLSLTSYNVIHIRCGDKYLTDAYADLNPKYVKNVISEIFNTIKNRPDSSYLVLTDNTKIKHIIANTFPSIKMLFNQITHLGQGFVQRDEAIKNTLLEFYLMSRAVSIVSFSSYRHGSGFSEWCAKTYNIPYLCKLIT